MRTTAAGRAGRWRRHVTGELRGRTAAAVAGAIVVFGSWKEVGWYGDWSGERFCECVWMFDCTSAVILVLELRCRPVPSFVAQGRAELLVGTLLGSPLTALMTSAHNQQPTNTRHHHARIPASRAKSTDEHVVHHHGAHSNASNSPAGSLAQRQAPLQAPLRLCQLELQVVHLCLRQLRSRCSELHAPMQLAGTAGGQAGRLGGRQTCREITRESRSSSCCRSHAISRSESWG